MTKYWIALLAALILNAGANLLMKAGMRSIEASGGLLVDGAAAGILKVLTHPALLVGMVCFAANLGCYMFALQRLNISVAYPIMVTVGFILILLVSMTRFGERLSTGQWIGVALVLSGAWLVASGPEPGARTRNRSVESSAAAGSASEGNSARE